MSTVIVRRTQRADPPALPSGEILLQPPPEIPEAAPDNFRQTLMYLPMVAMMVEGRSATAQATWLTTAGLPGGTRVARVACRASSRAVAISCSCCCSDTRELCGWRGAGGTWC